MSKYLQKSIGRNLRALIKGRGYRTYELFAHENKFDKGWIGRILRGDIDPGFTKIIKITKALDADLRDLWPGPKKK